MKKPIEISDLYRLKLVTDPQISPDGDQVAFVVERMDKQEKKYFTTLSLVPAGGGRVRPLTTGKKNDTLPRWSPDGKTLAFVSKREESAQIWLLPSGGGRSQVPHPPSPGEDHRPEMVSGRQRDRLSFSPLRQGGHFRQVGKA